MQNNMHLYILLALMSPKDQLTFILEIFTKCYTKCSVPKCLLKIDGFNAVDNSLHKTHCG